MADHHKVLIVGGGTAGISVAARLKHGGVDDVAVIEPSERHFYQPLWTLVGGGCAPAAESERTEASVMPKDVTWIKAAAADVDPEGRTVTLEDGRSVAFDYLVMCPGIQLDWDKTAGLPEAMQTSAVSSNS
jgi:sulfide:quinone oxidoreductase